MTEPYARVLLHEYFYKRLSELDETERELISAIRTKTGLVILCDKLRAVEIEKQVIIRLYEELRCII